MTQERNNVITDFLVFKPDGDDPVHVFSRMPQEPGYDRLKEFIMPLLGENVEGFEHVSVLYEGKPHDMFVDDRGAIGTKTTPPSDINVRATAIYHAYGLSIGTDMRDAASIFGVAVLATRKVWF
jgi:hypothetical protein